MNACINKPHRYKDNSEERLGQTASCFFAGSAFPPGRHWVPKDLAVTGKGVGDQLCGYAKHH